MYAADGAWWELRKPDFKGLRLSQNGQTRKIDGAHLLTLGKDEFERYSDELLTEVPGVIGYGGNSGFQAYNAVVQFGANPIILVGFDMRLDNGIHWHGSHPSELNNPSAENILRWRRLFDASASKIHSLGVTVVNASFQSAITAFPFVSLERALRGLP